ncbi:MAG: NAD-dependent malic enzyme [Fibrobacteres bacterium]|nr:NAD-dependent malic enzyme [Fibrobacterota bacterium]
MKNNSPGYSIKIRVKIANRPGMLASILNAVAEAGGDMDEITNVGVKSGMITRDLTINGRDFQHELEILSKVRALKDVTILSAKDVIFEMHEGGKMEVQSRIPLNDQRDLSRAYTPGVARACLAINKKPELVHELTIKKNMVAVVSDGTAVLGLGDIGPDAGLPVMEGKAVLFKKFGNVDAFPICLNTKDPEEIIKTVKNIAVSFGGINLEDISAPRCFEIEERLINELDIPVFHDDQHGTAVVSLAALINATKLTGRTMESLKVVVNGAGAAGVACTKLMMDAGVKNVILCDTAGAIFRGRTKNMNPSKEAMAKATNPNNEQGTLGDVIKNADLFVGVSGPHCLKASEARTMAKSPLIFAMSNPVPEIQPEEIKDIPGVVIATGRSDYPNQINNVLCFPGLFRGALDAHALKINTAMKLAAARALAALVKPEELCAEYIIPSAFHPDVAATVAKAVAEEAVKSGVTRKPNTFNAAAAETLFV